MLKPAPIVKRLGTFLLSFSLIFTPQLTRAATISLLSGLSHLEMDLGSADLRVEQIDSNMQLATDARGILKVAHVKAKRVLITMKENNKVNTENPNLLPEKINLLLPIIVQDAAIDEIVIKSGESTTTLKHVSLSLDASDKNLKIVLSKVTILVVQKSKGLVEKYDAKMQLNINNQKPFNLDGFIEAIQKDGEKNDAKNSVKVDLSGSLQHLHFSNKTALSNRNNANNGLLIVPYTGQPDTFAQIITEGEISLEGHYPVTLHTSLQNFKPELALNNPNTLTGLINLKVDGIGELSPSANFKVSAQTTRSRLNASPLQINAAFFIENKQLKALNLTASLAKNQLSAAGDLGAEGSNISWNANLSGLSSLGEEFAGTLKSNGKIKQQIDSLSFQYQLSAEKLRLPDLIKIENIQAQGTISTASGDALSGGTLANDIKVIGLSKNDSAPINASLMVNGLLEKHVLSLAINNTNNTDDIFNVESIISGGFGSANPAQNNWQGQIESITSANSQKITLANPARMQWSSEYGFALQNFALNINQGKVLIESLLVNNNATNFLQTKGHIDQLALQDLPSRLLALPSNIKQNLVLNGSWNINVADTIDADIKILRDSGDVLLIKEDNKTLTLGIENMLADLNIQHNNLKADIRIAGSNLGTFNADFNSALTKSGARFGLSQSAPLKLNIDGQLKTLAWQPFPSTIADAQSDGIVQLKVTADGTISAPNLMGNITGNALSFNLPSQGVHLRNGTLKADFTDKSLAIKQLIFTSGAGTIQATGHAELSDGKPTFNLDWRADKLSALSRTDRFLVLTGTAKTQLQDNLLTLNGDFKVLNGLFELPKNSAPTLSDDVIIISQGEDLAEKQKRKANPNALKINISALNIDFGPKPTTSSLSNGGTNIATVFDPNKQFIVRGNGIEGSITGAVTLSGKPDGTINSKGSLDIDGTYLAYGQILNIGTGTINFSGPIENAGLNILATRNASPVKPGVQITGNMRIPTVKLVSTPEVSDSDKLSWLILGQPLSTAGESGVAILSLAANSLLSNGDSVPLQTRLARSAGFDSLSVNGSNASTYSVSVGKRLSQNLYIGYEKSLFGLLNVAKLTYDITKRISLVTRAGSDSAVDVLYTFNFD
ncbi:MAG: translocation/assembly module TamB domain-containing protein [Methylophilaceae bacterium]|nr:translocation/assembly module TamB domain-containing protein [Methylophilaceae bacterium]